MQYRESFTTKPGQKITIRSCLAADGEAVLEVFHLSHQETDFLLAYPDEVHMNAQQEGAFLQCKADNPREVQLIAIDENQVVGIAGIIVVLLMLVGEVGKLFDTICDVFGF